MILCIALVIYVAGYFVLRSQTPQPPKWIWQHEWHLIKSFWQWPVTVPVLIVAYLWDRWRTRKERKEIKEKYNL